MLRVGLRLCGIGSYWKARVATRPPRSRFIKKPSGASRAVLKPLICLAMTAGSIAVSHAQTPRVLCPEGQELDPYEIWSEVDSEEEAKAFLRSEYRRFHTPMEFATWLSCQSFIVGILNGPKGTVLREGELMISAGFLIAPMDRSALWGGSWIDTIIPKHAHSIKIYIDESEKIYRVYISLTSK